MSTEVVKQNEFVENSSLGWQNVGDKIKRKIMPYDGSLMLVKVQFEEGGVGTLHHHYHSQITHMTTSASHQEFILL